MSDVISRHSRNGAVEFISPAAEAMLGTPVARLLGHGLFDRVHVADRPAYLTALSDAARGGEAAASNFGFAGTRFAARTVPSISSGSKCVAGRWSRLDRRMRAAEVVAVMREVTDRKLQEQALDLARSAAEQADAAKTRFLATMSHELRTPLNAIIGFSEMIVQEQALMLDPARRKEYAQLINNSGQHLLAVVNGILDISKMESGNFEIAPEPFAPRAALVNCCNLLALKARENGVDLVISAPEDLPVINGDPRAFRQIALNLVSNAIKFTERGGQRDGFCRRRGIAADASCHRHRRRHRRRGSQAHRRSLLPGRHDLSAPPRRHRPRPVDREEPGRIARWRNDRAEPVDEGTTVTVALPLDFAPPLAPTNNVATLTPALRSGKQDQSIR